MAPWIFTTIEGSSSLSAAAWASAGSGRSGRDWLAPSAADAVVAGVRWVTGKYSVSFRSLESGSRAPVGRRVVFRFRGIVDVLLVRLLLSRRSKKHFCFLFCL